MTKKDIVRIVGLQTGHTQADVELIFEGILGVLKDTLRKNDPIEIRNFGTFKVILGAKRKGRDIRRHGEVIIPESYRINFKPSKSLTREMNECRKIKE